MKNPYSRMENICPKEPKKLRIPDQLDLYMEDGTIYHVRSFFARELVMGDVLDALTMEKLERAQLIPALCPVESTAAQWYNTIRISDCDMHCISGG